MPDTINTRRTRRRSILLAPLGLTLGAVARGETADDVWLDLTEPVPAGARDAAQAEQRRLRVAAQQDQVAQRLRELGVVELARTVHARNAILVRITPAQTELVRDIPGVRRLRASRTLRPPKPMP